MARCRNIHVYIYCFVDSFCIGKRYIMVTYCVSLFVSLFFNYMTHHLFCLCGIYVTTYVSPTMTSLKVGAPGNQSKVRQIAPTKRCQVPIAVSRCRPACALLRSSWRQAPIAATTGTRHGKRRPTSPSGRRG